MAPKENPKPAAKPATDTPEGERIAKVLSRAGISSRREAERLIEAGEVKVNGKIITSPALNVTARDKITVSGHAVGAPEPARMWLYYKPEGLVTSASDEKGRDTVFDHLPEDMPRVMSIGRLDLNSEGLLLLTNDGELKRRLELPSTGWLRKYRVRVKGNPTDPDLEPLRKGIVVDGERFQAMDVRLDRHQGSNAWLTIGLREGKNREIRRAIDAIGLIVNRLIRISYGPFRLNELKPGEVEEVKPRVLRDQLGMTDPDDGEAQATPRRKPIAKPGAKPTGRAPRPTDAKPGAKPAAAPRGRPAPSAGVQSLSDAWEKAIKPVGKAASRRNPASRAEAEPEPVRKPRTPASKPTPRAPSTRNAPANPAGKPPGRKPPSR